MDPTRLAGRREWIGLAVLVLPCLLVSMDVSVLFMALPFISADLAPTATEQLWVMDAYGFALAGLLITMGAVGDRIGRRRLLLVGAAAFGVTSAVAAYSHSADVLIGARALLGVAGATLMPSTLALVRTMFPDAAQRKTAIAVWTAGMTTGAVIGPIVGGFLLDHFWWGSVFLINIPAMVLLLLAGPALLPEFRSGATGRFDVPGAALSLAAVVVTVYGVKQVAVDGPAAVPVAALVLGALLGVAFVQRQRRADHPLIDLALLRSPAFNGAVSVNAMTMFCFIGITLFTHQYLQLVLGLRPFEAALWSLTVMPVIAVALTVTGVVARRARPATVICAGIALLAVGLACLALLETTSPLWLVLASVSLVAAGTLAASTLTGDLILTAAPVDRAGTASALSETGSELGGALGMAVLGSIGAAVYRTTMDSTVDTPTATRETLGGAIATHDPTIQAAAREAFTHALTTTALTAAALAAVFAVIAHRLLHREPAPVG